MALARGRIWTSLLDASYRVVITALEADDLQTASNWLSLREFRQSTRVSLVTDVAQSAISDYQAGTIEQVDMLELVTNDLRDTYFFRLRDSLNELDDAINRDYSVRAAEWVGHIEGYYSIIHAHFRLEQGDNIADALSNTLTTLETLVLANDWEQAHIELANIRDLIANYRPIELTTSEIAERGQLLYIFTDLVYIEYKDGVRDGEITIEVEYQEALTFRDQAQSYFEELRPIIARRKRGRCRTP